MDLNRLILINRQSLDVPVVPMAIAGARDVLPPIGFNSTPGHIRIRMGKPIDPFPSTGSNEDTLRHAAYESVKDLYFQLCQDMQKRTS